MSTDNPKNAISVAGLIKRLEAATGPDRKLDLEIAIAVWGRPGVLVLRHNDETGQNEEYTHWRYTSSIDDALTLVPEHYSCELTQSATEPPRFARARLWDWRRGPLMSDPDNEWKSEGNRPLAVALCIAALKARQARQKS